MAEQLLLSGNVGEEELCKMNIAKERINIGVSLLTHSGTVHATCVILWYTLNNVSIMHMYIIVDMSERCIMCGASDWSFDHRDYDHWV